jgi:hypothetical protein
MALIRIPPLQGDRLDNSKGVDCRQNFLTLIPRDLLCFFDLSGSKANRGAGFVRLLIREYVLSRCIHHVPAPANARFSFFLVSYSSLPPMNSASSYPAVHIGMGNASGSGVAPKSHSQAIASGNNAESRARLCGPKTLERCSYSFTHR